MAGSLEPEPAWPLTALGSVTRNDNNAHKVGLFRGEEKEFVFNLLIIAVILPALVLLTAGLSPSLFFSSQFSPEPDSVKFFTDFSSCNLLFLGGFLIFGLPLATLGCGSSTRGRGALAWSLEFRSPPLPPASVTREHLSLGAEHALIMLYFSLALTTNKRECECCKMCCKNSPVQGWQNALISPPGQSGRVSPHFYYSPIHHIVTETQNAAANRD